MTTSTLVMPFGKYKGTAITELKLSYVNWLLTLDNLKSDLRLSLEALVAERQRRQAFAIGMQSSHIPLHERRAYKKRMGWVGAR